MQPVMSQASPFCVTIRLVDMLGTCRPTAIPALLEVFYVAQRVWHPITGSEKSLPIGVTKGAGTDEHDGISA